MNGADVALPAQLTLDHVSPATLLLEKRRQMTEVQQALDAQKEEYDRKEAMFKRREQQLRKKDLELQENLCQFNKFLKDKSDKRQQYLQKAEVERKEKHLKIKEMAEKKKALQGIKGECSGLEADFKENEKYDLFLEAVKRRYDQEYPEIEHILKRHEVLEKARRDLEVKEVETSQQLEQMRIRLSEFTQEQHTRYLDLNNLKQRMQKKQEDATNAAQELETRVTSVVQQRLDRTRELGEITMSVQNIYDRCRHFLKGVNHHQNIKPWTVDDLEAQDISEMDPEDMGKRERTVLRKENERKLDIISCYIRDVVSLGKNWEEELQDQAAFAAAAKKT